MPTKERRRKKGDGPYQAYLKADIKEGERRETAL
jgi:hypothetical protein